MISYGKRAAAAALAFFLAAAVCLVPGASIEAFAQGTAPIPVESELMLPEYDYASVQEDLALTSPSDAHGMGHFPNEFTVEAPDFYYHDSDSPQENAVSIPAAYDLRDYGRVTSVKDQGQYGACWTFSTMACVESNLITRGYADSSLDLSEKHLAYYTYNYAPDKLNNTYGDYTTPIGDHYLDIGGNSWLAACTLAGWEGLILDREMPYDGPNQFDPYKTYPAYNAYMLDKYHIDSVTFVATSSVDYIKEQIMKKGAAEVGIYYSDTFMNSSTGAHCSKGVTTTNHSVTIIGWDDNYSRYNFSSGYRPSGNGAWLIKNSWGPDWWCGDNGYFWVSYEDSSFCAEGNEVTFFEASPIGGDYNIYQYDGSHGSRSINAGEGNPDLLAANIYTAADNEYLTQVGFYTNSANIKYSIQVYTGVSNRPDNGTKAFSVPQTGTVGAQGYHTVTLTNPVKLTKGQKFSIVLKLDTMDGSRPGYMMDSDYAIGWLDYTSYAKSGQSFYGFEGYSWTDLTSFRANSAFRIKGITQSQLFNANVPVHRLSGNGRTETAVSISKEGFERAENVILASGDNFADALAGVPLAYALNAPILLVRSHQLDSATLSELSRLGARNIYILGGTGAVGAGAESRLWGLGYNVYRIAGETRFETAVRIAEMLQSIKGAPTEVFFAYSHSFPDALAISSVAAVKGCPILYIAGNGSLDSATNAYLAQCGADYGTILGGTGVISSMAELYILFSGVENVARISGENRYETCIKINQTYGDVLTGNSVCVATGTDFPDALAGGVFAALQKSPMLLVNKLTGLTAVQSDYLRSREIKSIYIMGGTSAVPDNIAWQVNNCA